MTDQLNLIQARKREIAASRAEHISALEALESESAELEIAERVIARLVGAHRPSAPIAVFASLADKVAPALNGKPSGTPTVPEMIVELLRNHNTSEPAGLDVKAIVQLIGEKWWPAVSAADISPIAWRMAKRGQLAKNGAVYSLPVADQNGVTIITPPEGDEPPSSEAE